MVSRWMSVCLSVLSSFPDDNLSNCKWIFTKLGMSMILWRSGLGLLMRKFCQIFTE